MGAFVAFSLISGKQAHDLLPELPALALLLSGSPPARRWGRRNLWLAAPVIGLVLASLATDAGFIPVLARLGDPLPLWSLALGGLCALTGLAASLRLRARVTAFAALPLALLIGLHLGLSPLLSARYDMIDLGRAVAPHDAAGIAVTDGTYHAHLNFAGRLLNRSPACPTTPLRGGCATIQAVCFWTRRTRPPGMTPVLPLPFRNKTYTLHRSQKVAP